MIYLSAGGHDMSRVQVAVVTHEEEGTHDVILCQSLKKISDQIALTRTTNRITVAEIIAPNQMNPNNSAYRSSRQSSSDWKTRMDAKSASRIQSHADKTGNNQDFKARAQSAAEKNEE